jgi:electron transfer flavoprotein beta subunit
MRILVCIKQVPGTAGVKINPETGTLIRESTDSILNPLDEFALEEALRLRGAYEGSVTALSMGPPAAQAVCTTALSLGADAAYLLCDKAFAGADTWATAYTLAAAVRVIGRFDCIICGKQAIDGDTAQVGPELARMLDIPFVAWVNEILSYDAPRLVVQRMMEEEFHRVAVSTPVLISVLKDINIPRIPTLEGELRAHETPVQILDAQALGIAPHDCGLTASPTQIKRTFRPVSHRRRRVVRASQQDPVSELLASIDTARADTMDTPS